MMLVMNGGKSQRPIVTIIVVLLNIDTVPHPYYHNCYQHHQHCLSISVSINLVVLIVIMSIITIMTVFVASSIITTIFTAMIIIIIIIISLTSTGSASKAM